MPKVHPTYFELHLELVSPRDQAHVDLLPHKPYALVLIRASSNVYLIADLKLNDQKIDGGHRIVFDDQKQLYCCYSAPATNGKHKIIIYGRQGGTKDGRHSEVLDLTLNVNQRPRNPVNFLETWKNFFDLGLEVISPQNTHQIKLNNGINHTEILIKASENIELLGRLENERGQKVIGGDCVYYDRGKNIWRCQFAPDRDGLFDALIMAKRKSDPESYTPAVSFKIEAKEIRLPPLCYPKTWQLFYDLDMKIETPRS